MHGKKRKRIKREKFLLLRNISIIIKQLRVANKRYRKKFVLNQNRRRLYIKMTEDERIGRMSEKDVADLKKKVIYKNRKRIEESRKKILKMEHKKYNYTSPNEIKVTISGEFGVEQGGIDYFVRKASEIIDFNAQKLTIDIQNCTKMWPSAITLLCSLVEWVEYCKKYIKDFKVPRIFSTYSMDDRVNGYLSKSGFFEFIHKSDDTSITTSHRHHVIKIVREIRNDSNAAAEKEEKIIEHLKNFTKYTPAEIKLFVSTVIMEVFVNIQEHGIQVNDSGWWFLAQFHSNHDVISINIADNGIGIRNSLLSGPQKLQIKSCLKEKANSDGEMIKYAMAELVSGAIGCDIEDKYKNYFRGYSLIGGQRRGNGLDRIRETCKDLNVPFAIISHRGYIYYDAMGNMSYGTEENRIFAGTLYHFDFPVSRSKR